MRLPERLADTGLWSAMWRVLRRHPALNLMIVVTLALGMASSMTAFALWAQLAADPLPGHDAGLQVVQFDARQPSELAEPNSDRSRLPGLLTLVDGQRLLAGLPLAPRALMFDSELPVAVDRLKIHVPALITTRDVFELFGMRMIRGAAWTAGQEQQRLPLLVLTAALAERLYGSVDVVGRSLDVQGRAFVISGVIDDWKPRLHFHLPESGLYRHADEQLFVSLPAAQALDYSVDGSCACDHGTELRLLRPDPLHCRWLALWTTAATAREAAAAQDWLRRDAEDQRQLGRFATTPQTRLTPLAQWLEAVQSVPGDVHIAAVLGVGLFVVCLANMVALLTARFLARGAEFGIRRALGARRRAVFRHCVGEAGLLALLATLLALPLVLGGLAVIRQQPASWAAFARLDAGLFVILALCGVTVALLAASMPAWRASRVAPALQIRRY